MHQKDSTPRQVLELNNFALQSGAVMPKLQLSYTVHGKLNSRKDNAILFPTWFASTRSSNKWLIGDASPLDTTRYAVIVVDALGNGESTSPSNAPSDIAGTLFPAVSVYDNCRAQLALLDALGISTLQLFIGRSMGAQQAFCFSACFPSRVRRVLALTGSAVTTPHNFVFLDGLEAALTADPAFYIAGDEPKAGLSAFGRVFAGWVLSQNYYRRQGWREEVDVGIDAYVRQKWHAYFLRRDAHDLYSLIQTWKFADLAANPVFEGDQLRALAAIKAKTIILPSRSDLYFPVEDSAWAASHMTDAQVRVIESDFGHRAGAPGSSPRDLEFVAHAIRDLMNEI